jgi:CTP:molybdopterin cytidylyltransferase MocA
VKVAAAVLAAGQGTRFAGDEPKPLALLAGRSLVSWALGAALDSDLRPVVLAVPPDSVALAATAGPDVDVVVAEQAAQGIAWSLRAVLDDLEGVDDVSAVCIGLADQPRIGADAYRRLADAHRAGADLAVSTYDGKRGNPVLIGRPLWPAARVLDGDVGAKALMRDHDVTEVNCTGTGDPRDVDTLDDLHALEEEIGRP